MQFADRVLAAIEDKGNPICVGLDPNLEFIPAALHSEHAADTLLEFSTQIIDAIADIVPMVKPQSAYFEALGAQGVAAFDDVVQYAKKKGLIVLADIKRGDIGNTAKAYSAGYLGSDGFNVDAVTVNPYLGSDSIVPFVEDCAEHDKGMFVLVKTSNPSSSEFQDVVSDGATLFESVAEHVVQWGSGLVGDAGYSAVGAVVGATHPEQLAELRSLMPQQLILVPGYGAQGGGAQDVVGAFDENKQGALIVAARSILYAYKNHEGREEAFAQCAREATEQMAEELKAVLS